MSSTKKTKIKVYALISFEEQIKKACLKIQTGYFSLLILDY